LPAYNEERWITECLDSVLNQSYDDVEVVVVDDGSTDATPEIVKSHGDDRIQYYRQENKGSAAARNTALSHATGEYIAIIDADDVWFKQKLERQLSFMNRIGAPFSFTNMEIIGEDGSTIGVRHESPPPQYSNREEFLKNLFMKNFICHPTVMFHAKTVTDREFDVDFTITNDHDLYLRIASEYEVGYLDEILTRKRYHGDNISGTQNYEQLYNERVRFVEKMVDQYPTLGAIQEKKLSQVNQTYALHLIQDGKTSQGRHALLRSIQHNPANWRSYAALLLSITPNLLGRLTRQR